VGNSRIFRKTVELGKKFADTRENILLLGESGTGKELFARAIHNRSRFYGPFVAVNCAALPRNLIESELFGYEEGGFTGARRKGRLGKIELAQGGTLFLDEIGEMPYEVQAVLLGVIEDKMVIRVGGSSYRRVNCRIVAATNRDPRSAMTEAQFLDDLYFRLSTFSLSLPPQRPASGLPSRFGATASGGTQAETGPSGPGNRSLAGLVLPQGPNPSKTPDPLRKLPRSRGAGSL
jgi:transcriptional regulator with PAS, ATPase and Fis domain